MKTFCVLALLMLSSAAFSEGTFGYKEEEDVVVLTDANFNEAIKKFEFVLVEFYAPWCGHCKKLAPEYAKAAKTLKGLDTPIPLAKVDATENSESAKAHGVQGYPTLKFFANGNAIDYNGGRTADDIVNWIKKKTGPPSTELADNAALQGVEKTEKVFAVYFSAGDENTKNFETFKQAALAHDDVAFYHTADQAAYDRFGNPKRIAVFAAHSGEYTFLASNVATLDAQDIANLIAENRFPLVMEFEGDEAIARIFQGEKPAVFFFSDDEKHTFLPVFTAAALADSLKTEAKKLIFSTSKLSSGLGQRLADFVGAKAADGASIWIVKPGQELAKFKFDGELNQAALEKFIADWRADALDKHLKSQEVPASNNEPVKVVVGKNFQDLVVDNDKWVLLEFYAPWCGHCKKLAPIYDTLAKDLAHIENLVIAKIDATENEIPSVSVQGFPTLKLFAPGKKDAPVTFESDRTLEGLKKGLKEHMKDDFKETAENTDL